MLNGLVRAVQIIYSLQPEHLSSFDTNRVAVIIGLMSEQSCGPIQMTSRLFGVPPSRECSAMDGGVSNCLDGQACSGCSVRQGVRGLRIALRVVSRFCIQAMRATFLALPSPHKSR